MFGRASSTPIQKLETDPSIAIVPCEAVCAENLGPGVVMMKSTEYRVRLMIPVR
jgi:hypothetical protein